MIKKKYYLLPKIISLFFILFLFSIKVQAISNISINLKAPIHEGVIEDKELNIDGEIESISKIKLAYVYIDNNNVGQAKLNELEFKENTYKTKLEYNKDISSLKDGVYNLKILAIDEQDNKEEKEISIKIKRNQEEVSDNRVNIYEEQLVENDKNIVQRNLEYDNVKISSTEKALTTVYNKATISNLEVSLNGTVVTNGKLEQGKTYTIKGNGNSANGVLYQFWIKDPYTQVWQMIRDYGTGNSMNWTPTRTGKYLVGIHVKDKNSKERLDDHKYVEYNVEQNSSKATISNLEVSLNGVLVINGKLEQGKTYTIKGNGNSANGVLYQFWIKDPYTQVWQMIRDYGTGNSMNWTPTRTGKYLVGIHVKDKNSKERLDDHKYLEYNVEQSSSKATISNLEVSLNGVLVTNGNLEQGKTYAIKGNGNSANGVLYQFWIKDPYTQVWQMIRDYGTGNSVNWAPTRTGQYLVGIHVKDKYSKEKLDDHKYVEYNVAASNKRTIVIDAGHGGYDSGAVGPTGIKEKDVTLKVALKVGKILENNGIRVIYTRTSDNVSWPSNESQDLAARVAIANNNNTDLFVSIHANSFNGSAHGTETYYYDGSAKGKEAATAVQKELINSIGLYDRGVKTAGYYVLRNTISPSILVELGFIDNRNEEVLLNSDWFQQKCAEAIAKGIIGTSFI
ncbi:N-acetylmuramoyl-L-alanine amidase [Clostridium sporogenes]|uniref:N-acetylmuramoyl-L-alanine amidase n=1 Tax=Clostridium sporogenes TaxID=1509 RepID=UPI0013D46393|nr:N-acetylmuramoyl-L-alanine amidase [Clostridium sporogenes]NFF68077.1 N-acetylmuramoyl-L-alanine amidase [Clostridium sporogenes]NFF78109.1 N-acetylmuramoyl-L-alanine amidase [Clostridium sporogenes]NFF96312.1 N-acetylmuramoyl-L-alanine amidase [Clostridium sporogenes]NFU81425.1 N-acetylmuramoyl-L-alanine amidase [Clostridium sporogenes]NFU89227.1 N-acetylmuramoyl-L-alanine amidase [Clostridium sporogenes]